MIDKFQKGGCSVGISKWLTSTEAAGELGVTDQTIRNLVYRGALKGHRFGGGGYIRIHRDSLQKLIDDSEIKISPRAKELMNDGAGE